MSGQDKTVAAPQGRLVTPFNIFAALVLIGGGILVLLRFIRGSGATTNATDYFPWGLLICFDVLCGVALAASGYCLAAAVYIFGLKKYQPLVRPAVLTGFLAYALVVVSLLLDLGRPWRLHYPLVYTFGVASVMFLVAWHVFLYLTVQFVEFCPTIFEWLNWRGARRWAKRLTVGATILGVILSILHQSALGALFLISPTKVHPLWYTPLLPLLFFTSSIVAGVSVVIIVSALSHRIFPDRIGPRERASHDALTIGLGKAGAISLFCYFFLKWIGVARGQSWDLLGTSMGSWFLSEMLLLVALPCILFAAGVRLGHAGLVRITALLAVIGVVINRLNVSIFAFRWDAPEQYVPHWMEIVISLFIITVGVVAFRWIVRRMPVLSANPGPGTGRQAVGES